MRFKPKIFIVLKIHRRKDYKIIKKRKKISSNPYPTCRSCFGRKKTHRTAIFSLSPSRLPLIFWLLSPLPYRDGFESDTHGNGSECHYLPYFNSNTDTNSIGYEYKTDSSNSDLHSDTYLIWNIAS
jgi:hypothetical protein